MITVEALQEAGYREFKPHKGDRHFQKWVRDESGGKLYALNFYAWHRSGEVHFSAEARLYQNTSIHEALTFEGETDLDLSLILGDPATVGAVENFFNHSFNALDCVKDPHNE